MPFYAMLGMICLIFMFGLMMGESRIDAKHHDLIFVVKLLCGAAGGVLFGVYLAHVLVY